MENSFFDTDQILECTKPIEFTYEQLLKCSVDSYNWKWVIIGFHNALQNCMVHTLRDSTGTNILKENLRALQYKSILKGEFGNIDEKLNYFLDIYEDIKSDKMLRFTMGKKYIPQMNDDANVKELNNIRNFFIHYIPQGYRCTVEEILDMCFTAFRIIRFLIYESHNFLLGETEREETKEILIKIESLLNDYSNRVDKLFIKQY
ncbi:MAG: hypothetical protein ACOYN6_10415 [Ignavibacteria bacterium]